MLNEMNGPSIPILSELDNLSPHAKAALAQAHNTISGQMPGGMPDQVGMTGGSAQPAAPITPIRNAPSMGLSSGSGGAGAAPMPISAARPIPILGPRVQDAESEVQRIRDSGSGISQIHNPVLRGLGYAADAVGSGLFPRIASVIPGTQAHHEQVLGGAEKNLKTEQGMEQQAVGEQEKAAQTANLESLPELHKAQSELAQQKQDSLESDRTNKDELKKSQTEAQLHAHGYKTGPDGAIMPLSYEEMSQEQQSIHDLKGSQQELADATIALRQAQTANEPMKVELAKQRIATAQRNAETASGRLGLGQLNYQARNFGTDAHGQALPGTVIGDDGKPVGSAFQHNVAPTGQERNKADLASSAHDQIQDMKDIVQRRSDIFGPVAGRKTDFDVWLGSQDADAKRFSNARTIAGDHLAGVFGGRSEAALTALDHAIGLYKENPKAVLAGLDQLDHANDRFVNVGTPRTTGSESGNAFKAEHAGAPESKVSYTVNGKTYHIPPNEEKEFLKDFPNAKKANAK